MLTMPADEMLVLLAYMIFYTVLGDRTRSPKLEATWLFLEIFTEKIIFSRS